MNFKKFLFIILAPLLLASCGPNDTSQSGDTTTSEEVHQYSDIYEKDETGHWKVCTVIGHTDKTEKEAHKYGEWKTLREADVHKDKVEHRYCSVCDYEEKRTIENSGTHTYVLKNDETKHWYESTCDHEIPLKKGEENHTFSDWTTLSEAELHKDKVEHRLCSVCNYEEKRTIDNTGTHTFDSEWKFDKTNHWHESTCGHSPALKADIAAHVMGEWIEITPATYTSNRVDERKCTICEYKETREITKSVQNLTLKPIGNRTFDGLIKPVTEEDLVFDSKENGLTIEYKKKGTDVYSSDAPIYAGTYEYRVTLGETKVYALTTASGEFKIDPIKLKLPSTTFENGEDVGSEGVKIATISTKELCNDLIDHVWITVPRRFASSGTHNIPISAVGLSLDQGCFVLDFESTTAITLINYDTKPFIAGISSASITDPTNPSRFIVKTKIAQGTVSVNDTLYAYGANKNVEVKEIRKSGVSVNKATINDEVDLYVSGLTVANLKVGTVLAKTDSFEMYQSAFAFVDIDTTPTELIHGQRLTISFEETYVNIEAEITLPSGFSTSDTLFDDVRIDFPAKIANWQDREFKIKSGSQVLGEGAILTLHNHEDTYQSDGTCTCGFNNSATLTFISSSAQSETLPYFSGEVRIFNATFTGGSAITGVVDYKFEMLYQNSDNAINNFSIKVIKLNSEGQVISTEDVNSENDYVYQLYGKGSFKVKIVVTRTSASSEHISTYLRITRKATL